MKKTYPFLNLADVNQPYMDELVDATSKVIRSGRYIGGEEVEIFEQNLSHLTGAKYAIGVSNGLDALRLILHAYVQLGQLKRGDEVIVPANTYIASMLAISDTGLIPVPADVDILTMNIDTKQLSRYITPKTKAIMTVHLYGRVAWDNNLMDIVRRHGLKIIEDCAQAIGAKSTVKGFNGNNSVGNLGDAGAFSFYPTKNIGALGDAGAVVTNDIQLANTVRAIANYGSDRRYHNIYCGYNCRLDSIQAAMLNVKLSHVDDENADRFARAIIYSRTISHPAIITPYMSEHVTDNVWHQYVIRVQNDKRDEFMQKLLAEGVYTDIHYATPAHMQPCYKNLKHHTLPVTELLASEILSLPIGTGTEPSDVADISNIINNIEL